VALRRRTRFILIGTSLPLLFLISITLFLEFYFTSERLKALVVPRLQSILNREVHINEISLSLFPSFGLKAQGLQVANREGVGFSEEPLVYLDEFRLNVKLLPLLGRRLEVNRLSFNKPRILLEFNKEGEANFRQPAAADQKENLQEGLRIRTGEAGSLLLSNLEIKDGELEYRNQRENRLVKLTGIDLTFRMESLPEVKELRTEGDLKVARVAYGALEKPLAKGLSFRIQEKSRIGYQNDRLTMEEGRMEIQGPGGQPRLRFQMGGTLTLVEEKPSSLDITITSDNLDLKQILPFLPEQLVRESENPEVEGNAWIEAHIRGDIGEGKQPALSVNWTLTDGKIHYAKLPKAIADINLKGRLLSTEGTSELAISDFSARLGSSPIKMKLSLANLSDPYLDANLEGALNLTEVKDFYPLEAGKELSGLVRAKFLLKGKTAAFVRLKGSGALELQNVTITGGEHPIRNLNGFLSLDNEVLEAKRLTMQYGASDLSVSFTLRDYFSLVFSEKPTEGKLKPPRPSMRASISSRYFESTPSKEPIVLPPFAMEATAAISRFVYKGTTPFECQNLRANLSTSDNVIRLRNVSFSTLEGSLALSGTVDLRNKGRPQFDLQAEVKEVDGHSFLRRFTAFGEHLSGKLSISVALKGQLNDTLGFETKSLAGDGNILVHDGKLMGYPLMQRLGTFLDLPELQDPSFKSCSGRFRISDGRIGLPDVKIAASGSDFHLTGWHGFDGTLDYALTIRLSRELSDRFSGKSVAQQVGSLFKDREGRVTLFVLVGGTVADPKFRWDTQAAWEKLKEKVALEVEKKKEEVREKAKGDLQKKLDEGKDKLKEQLKKLFKKP